MFLSPFNVIVDLPHGEHALFNSVSGTVLTLDAAALDAVKEGRPSDLDLKTRLLWLRHRVLVNDPALERQAVTERLRKYRFRSNALIYTLVTTFACNLRCPYCYEDALPTRGSLTAMTNAIADAFVDYVGRNLAASGAKRVGITLYGGEPTLNMGPALRVFRKLKRLHAKDGVKVDGSMITNGTTLSPDILSELVSHVQYAQVTLDGGPMHHDLVRVGCNGRPTFMRILDSVELMLKTGMRVAIRIQITKLSAGSLDECFARLRERGLLRNPGVRLYFFPIMDIFKVCSARYFECGHRHVDPTLYDRLSVYAKRENVQLAPPLMPVWLVPYCTFLNRWSGIVVPDGDVYKCVAMVGRPEGVVDSLADNVYESVERRFRRERFERRSGLDFEECRQCECLPVCDGGCGFSASGAQVMNESRTSCEFRRETLRRQVSMMASRFYESSPKP